MRRTITHAALAAGCLLALAAAPARSEARSVEHTIRSGDNLHLIAGYYHGDPRQWRRVWKANRASISRPGRLLPGRVLKIEASPGGGWPGSYEDFLFRVRGK